MDTHDSASKMQQGDDAEEDEPCRRRRRRPEAATCPSSSERQQRVSKPANLDTDTNTKACKRRIRRIGNWTEAVLDEQVNDQESKRDSQQSVAMHDIQFACKSKADLKGPRPRFAFEIFRTYMESRSEFLFTEVGLVAMWRALKESERADYMRRATREKQGYETEQHILQSKFQGINQKVQVRKPRKGKISIKTHKDKGVRPPGFPDACKSPFLLFCRDWDAQASAESCSVSCVAGAQVDDPPPSDLKTPGEKTEVPHKTPSYWKAWLKLSSKQKEYYMTSALAERKHFEMQFNNWRQQNPEIGKKEMQRLWTQFGPRWKPDMKLATASLPGFPHPSISAYSFFHRTFNQPFEKRPATQDGNVRASAKTAWLQLPKDEKAQFHALAHQDRVRFRSELAAWSSQQPEETLKEAQRILCDCGMKMSFRQKGASHKQVGNTKSSGLPPQPLSAYQFFCAERRAVLHNVDQKHHELCVVPRAAHSVRANHSHKGSSVARADLKRTWLQLPAAEKAPYIAAAHEDNSRFLGELESWFSKQPRETQQEAECIFQKYKRKLEFGSKILQKFPPGFPKPVQSAYAHFCVQHRATACNDNEDQPDSIDDSDKQDEQQNISNDACAMQALSSVMQDPGYRQAWNELPGEMREQYEKIAHEDATRFQAEFQTWRSLHPEVNSLEASKLLLQYGRHHKPEMTSRKKRGTTSEIGGFPKRRRSAYSFFLKDKIAEIRLQMQTDNAAAADELQEGERGVTPTRDSRSFAFRALPECRSAWTALPQDAKAVYEDLSRKDQMRFESELVAWQANFSKTTCNHDRPIRKSCGKRTHAKRLSKAVPDGFPRACRSAYAFFCKDQKSVCQKPAQSIRAETKEGGLSQVEPEANKALDLVVSAEGASHGSRSHALKEYAKAWLNLPEGDKQHYLGLAVQDRLRFESEIKLWQESNPRTQLDNFPIVIRALKKMRRKQHKSGTLMKARPPGFPEPNRSAYAIFCKDHKGRIQNEISLDKGNVLTSLRKAWNGLAKEERQHYEGLAQEDAARFTSELEAWRDQQTDSGLGQYAKFLNRVERTGQKRLPRPRLPQVSHRYLKAQSGDADETMSNVLAGAFVHGLAEANQKSRKDTRKDKAQERVEDIGTSISPPVQSGELGGGSWFRREASTPAPSLQGGGLPTPKGSPAQMKPDESVGDLLGDLILSESGAPDEVVEDGYDLQGALTPYAQALPPEPVWSDTPQTSGAPRVLKPLGPQLCFDESGNIVLNQSSLSRTLDEEGPSTNEGPVYESVTHFNGAYNKAPATKWSQAETHSFYEALELYGTDLFLVQTFFKNKSASQIKSKFTREMKRNPLKVEEALTTCAKKLTKETFERLHGKIDTSKHYKPPPSPPPGHAQEPDGSVPGHEPEEQIPPEPEEPSPSPEPDMTAEDEAADTTNRLMALFD